MLAILFLIFRILATVVLFLFLAWALRVIWLDLKRQAAGETDIKVPSLRLIPLDNEELETYQANDETVLVGRDPACSLHLVDKTISGQHARLVYQMGQWWIEDLSSMNGTFVNQQVVATPVVLTTNDVVSFGQVQYQVQILDEPAFKSNSLKQL